MLFGCYLDESPLQTAARCIVFTHHMEDSRDGPGRGGTRLGEKMKEADYLLLDNSKFTKAIEALPIDTLSRSEAITTYSLGGHVTLHKQPG